MEHYKKSLEKTIKEIKEAPEDSQISKSNKDLEEGGKTWAGGGDLTLAGFIYWTSKCELILTDAKTGFKGVIFDAKGTGFMLGALNSEIAGAFVVDPSTIEGDCHFTIVTAAVEEGVTTLTLYSTSGKLYGTFAGPAEGAAVGTMSGTGKLRAS